MISYSLFFLYGLEIVKPPPHVSQVNDKANYGEEILHVAVPSHSLLNTGTLCACHRFVCIETIEAVTLQFVAHLSTRQKHSPEICARFTVGFNDWLFAVHRQPGHLSVQMHLVRFILLIKRLGVTSAI